MAQVREVMNAKVISVEPTASVVDAAKTMIQEQVGPLPVVEGERAVGMVTDRDLIARVVAEGRDPNTLTVNDVATTELVTIRPDQDVDEARQLMQQRQLDRLLVTEGDLLVGIISESDVRADQGPLA